MRKAVFEAELEGGGAVPRFNVLLTTYELAMKDKHRLRRFRRAATSSSTRATA